MAILGEEQPNKNAGIRICAIFYNHPKESFTYKEMIDRTSLPEGTVKSRIHRLIKAKILKRYRLHHRQPFSYKLLDSKKALDFIEKRVKKKRSSQPKRVSPTLPLTDDLDKVIPQTPHHQIQQVKLTDEEWKRTEHLFTKPKDNKDRGKQRILERKTFKMVISPSTLNGALYILEENWKGEVQELYPEMAEQIYTKEQLAHVGISFDAEVWQNFRMSKEDLKLLFATSHYWRELDVEGREIAVNSFMQHIMRDSFEKTTYEAINSKLIETMLIKQEGFDERMFQQVEILQKIDERLEKMEQNDLKLIEIFDKLTEKVLGEEKPELKKKENGNGGRELTSEDMIMFG